MSENGIVHVTSAPYHPSSNGLAERAVQTFKSGLKRTPGATIQERLSKFLFTYRITPQTTTGIAPAQLLMGRRPRSRLDTLFPDITQRVEKQQSKQAQQHDNSKPLRTFAVGDTVYVRDFTTASPTWIPGKVTKVTGPLSYHVELESGCVVRRHVDAIRRRDIRVAVSQETSTFPPEDDLYLPDVPPPAPHVATPEPTPPPAPTPVTPASPPPPPIVRQSARHHLPPDCLGW